MTSLVAITSVVGHRPSSSPPPLPVVGESKASPAVPVAPLPHSPHPRRCFLSHLLVYPLIRARPRSVRWRVHSPRVRVGDMGWGSGNLHPKAKSNLPTLTPDPTPDPRPRPTTPTPTPYTPRPTQPNGPHLTGSKIIRLPTCRLAKAVAAPPICTARLSCFPT